MADHHQERLADLLLTFLAEEIRQLNDPRLEMVTLTAVQVTRDLKVASVYWSALGTSSSFGPAPSGEGGGALSLEFPDARRIKTVAEALQGTEAYLKRRISEKLDLRVIPKLVFKYDESTERGFRIESLLKKAGY